MWLMCMQLMKTPFCSSAWLSLKLVRKYYVMTYVDFLICLYMKLSVTHVSSGNILKIAVFCNVLYRWQLNRDTCCLHWQGGQSTSKCWYLYRLSQEEGTKLRESVPYVKIYRYNPKHLYPQLNGYGDNGQRSFKLWQLLHTCWLPNTY
jgi:hypothetical protein